jgi:hypothetical protein
MAKPMAAKPSCVLRQAQDEGDPVWHHHLMPFSIFLILSLSKDAPTALQPMATPN